MGKYSKEDKINFKNYHDYVISQLDNSSGSKLVKERLTNEIKDLEDLGEADIRKICELVQFLKISENSKIYLYYDWFRHLRK